MYATYCIAGVNECGPRDFHPKCDEWSVCVPYQDASGNYQNFCVEINGKSMKHQDNMSV